MPISPVFSQWLWVAFQNPQYRTFANPIIAEHWVLGVYSQKTHYASLSVLYRLFNPNYNSLFNLWFHDHGFSFFQSDFTKQENVNFSVIEYLEDIDRYW